MDFFAAGGFQQLLSDLHGLKQDFPSMEYTDLDDLSGMQINAENQQHSDKQSLNTFCYNSERIKIDLSNETYASYNKHNDLHQVVSVVPEEKHFLMLNAQAKDDSDFRNEELTANNNINKNPQSDLENPLLIGSDPTAKWNTIATSEHLKASALNETDYFDTAVVTTEDMTEWEENFLDNYIEIPELIDFLPEKTPLCTELCEHFLQESSKNLNLYHESKIHTSNLKNDAGKGYLCTFENCKKIYSKPAHLKAHLRRHLGEKPYICTWPKCTWKFSRSDELSRHRRSHSGVKPYKCNYCSKCFARSDHLNKHRKVHERRLLAVNKVGKSLEDFLPFNMLTVRPGRKRKNQIF